MKKKLLTSLLILSIVCSFFSMSFASSVFATDDIIYGDVNGDDNVNGADRMMLARHLAEWVGYETLTNPDAADVNLDTNINGADRQILARHLAEWIGYEVLPMGGPVPSEEPSPEPSVYEPVTGVPSPSTVFNINVTGTNGNYFKMKSGNGISGNALGGYLIESWGLKVLYTNYGSSGTYEQKLRTLYSGSKPPHLIVDLPLNDADTATINETYYRGAYTALSDILIDLMPYENLLYDYINTVWAADPSGWDFVKNEFTDNGKLYVLPRKNLDMAYYMTVVDQNYLTQLGVTNLPSDWDTYYQLLKTAQQGGATPWATVEGHNHYIINPVANSYGITCDAGYAWGTMNGQPNWSFYWDEYLYTLRELNKMVDDKIVMTDPSNPNKLLHHNNVDALRVLWEDNIKNRTSFLAYERYEALRTKIQKLADDAGANSKWVVSSVQPVHTGYKTAAQFFTPVDNSAIALTKKCADEEGLTERLVSFINFFALEQGEKKYYNGDGGVDGAGQYGTYWIGRGKNNTTGYWLEERFKNPTIDTNSIYNLYKTYETVSTNMISNGTASYRMIWKQGTPAEESKIAALKTLAENFTNAYLNRDYSLSTDAAAWSTYIKALRSAGYAEVYALRLQQLGEQRQNGNTMGKTVSSMPKQSTVDANRQMVIS